MTSRRRSASWVTEATTGTTIRRAGCGPSGEVIVAGPAELSRLLLDSTVLIDALRGRSAADRLRTLRRVGTEPWVCAISVEEIWRGLRPEEEAVAQRLCNGLRLAPLGQAEGTRAGSWRRDLAAQGITVHQADCLIAAAAVGIGASLATGNVADFPMADLTVEHWPAGA
jgi:predicted nucleic acid-binding protein